MIEDLYLFPSDLDDNDFICQICGGEFWDGGNSCTCDDYEEYDDDDYDEDAEEREEYWLSNCSMQDDGDCLRAGDEECDFDCPFRRQLEQKEKGGKDNA
jgi:hypothetical protein